MLLWREGWLTLFFLSVTATLANHQRLKDYAYRHLCLALSLECQTAPALHVQQFEKDAVGWLYVPLRKLVIAFATSLLIALVWQGRLRVRIGHDLIRENFGVKWTTGKIPNMENCCRWGNIQNKQHIKNKHNTSFIDCTLSLLYSVCNNTSNG